MPGNRRHRAQAAAAARLPADPLERRQALRRQLHARISRLLSDRRRRLPRRGRLCLRHGPHRRHHQRRRPPALHRRRWRRCWPSHPDVAECAVIGAADALKGEVPVRLPGAEGRRHARPAGSKARSWSWCATARPGRRLRRDHGGPPAEDAVGQDPARDHARRSPTASWTMPATIEDPTVLDEIGEALKGRV